MTSKFLNKKVVIDGIIFQSEKEAERYVFLKILQSQGEISALEIQPKFEVWIKGQWIFSYTADFRYKRDGQVIVEDVKAEGKPRPGRKTFTTRTPLYQLKKKLVKALLGIEITEII